MKVAFLGKGGSGKSTLSSALVRGLLARGMRVLAVDADHNMDLSFNLGADPSRFLGSDPDLIKEHLGVARTGTFADALAEGARNGVRFTLSPMDAFTRSVATPLSDSLALITAGPHTERVRAQEACSHSLSAPLKAYLPLLSLSEGEAVVIDERAGTDPVATGILAGVDLAVIVREPTVHSARVAEQIAKELSLANVPHLIVDNKVHGAEEDAARAEALVFERIAA